MNRRDHTELRVVVLKWLFLFCPTSQLVISCVSTDATDKAPEEESNSVKKEEDDAFVHMFVNDVDPVFAHLPEEGQTLTTAPPSVLLHHLNDATRGQDDTSGQMDKMWLLTKLINYS